mmetsp:Transcript_16847/g.42097  ORF Transcript_16847/g.42097 Transcript_16847/m.42097 type:complete len:81 (-) Transcript_16847:122-364(-)
MSWTITSKRLVRNPTEIQGGSRRNRRGYLRKKREQFEKGIASVPLPPPRRGFRFHRYLDNLREILIAHAMLTKQNSNRFH